MRLRPFTAVVGLLSSVFVSSDDSLSASEDPSAFYTMIELVCSEGYHVQEHTVMTEDGYILKIFRIPGGKKRPKVPKRRSHYQYLHKGYHPDFEGCVRDSLHVTPMGPPVLLSHGLMSASDVWVLQGPKYDLAFMLADKDYDVWFTNIRGNFYGRQHKTLPPSDLKFWDFSFHENGVYDMPATIDHILERTGAPKLTYIGHSMGTTMFFVMASEKPEYKDKIKLFVGLTPVAQLLRKNFSFSRMTVFNFILNLVIAVGKTGHPEFFPRSHLTNLFTRMLCRNGSLYQDLCYDLSVVYVGYHSKLFLRKKIVLYLSHGFSGSSVKTFDHYGQMLDAPHFRQYDYGPVENLRKYGRQEPPEYDLGNVTVPTALFYSKGDYIADVKDIAVLKGLLPNVIEDVQLPGFNHLDFLWAYSAKELVYKRVVELVDEFRISEGRPDSERT